MLDVHGDADAVIGYGGGAVPANMIAPGVPSKAQPAYPSEAQTAQTMATWAAKNGCTGSLLADGGVFDLDVLLPGDDTVEEVYGGCPSGVDVELWTIAGGAHVRAGDLHAIAVRLVECPTQIESGDLRSR